MSIADSLTGKLGVSDGSLARGFSDGLFVGGC